MNKTAKTIIWVLSGLTVLGAVLFIPVKGTNLFKKLKEKFAKKTSSTNQATIV